MDFERAKNFLDEIGLFGINPSLDRIWKILELLGNPQKNFDTIHIVGTNGKTTTGRFCEALIRNCGTTTGLFTSPHLTSYTERILVNGEPISEGDFASRLEDISPFIDLTERAVGDGSRMTLFEILTAMAFLHFSKKGVQCAVIEAGMGGRWDSTNVIDSKNVIVTSIAYDHVERLGETLEQIASEKVDVIKGGSRVACGALDPPALKVIRERVREVGAKLCLEGEDFHFSTGDVFTTETPRRKYEDLELNVLGVHQKRNAALALCASEFFLNAALDPLVVKESLKEVESPGRLETVSRKPLVILDGAHNVEAAKALASALKKLFQEKIIFILAFCDDKNVKGFLAEIAPITKEIIAASHSNPRSLDPGKIVSIAATLGVSSRIGGKVEESLSLAIEESQKEDVICLTGSLFAVGDAKVVIRER